MAEKQVAAAPAAIQMLQKPAMKAQLNAALPKHMTPDRMLRLATTEMRNNPALERCSPASFVGAIVMTSQLGLEPGSGLGHAYLIPFGQQCQLIIGYKGMIELARRSGQVVSIAAHCVYEGDHFHYEFGLNETLEHAPTNYKDRGNITHVYAVAKLVGGGHQFEVLSLEEVQAIRDASPGAKKKDSPWHTHFEEMAKKTAIRRLFKYLPVSVEIQRAVAVDEAADAGRQDLGSVIEGEWEARPEPQETAPKPMGERAQAALDKARGKAQVEPEPAPEPDDAQAALQQELLDALNDVKTIKQLEDVIAKAGKLPDELQAPILAKCDEAADRIQA